VTFTFGLGGVEKFAIALVVIGGEMKRRWEGVVIGLLALSLVTITVNCIMTHNLYVTLQAEHDKVMQSLVKQTQLVVELRKKSVLRDFDSLDDLKQWVDVWERENKPTVVSILNHTFVIAGNDELYSQYWDCDDISEAMQRDALRDGYLMSVAVVSVGGVMLDHAGCMVTVENAYWFIETQTGEIVMIVGRD